MFILVFSILISIGFSALDVTGWKYMRYFTIENTGGAISEHYVIVIDTSTPIASSKMQSDCDDLRITDINNNELYFWLETPCGRTSTRIWVDASFTAGTNILKVYYGNMGVSRSAFEHASFTRFYVMSKIPCAGWPNSNEFYSRYLKGTEISPTDIGGDDFAHTHDITIDVNYDANPTTSFGANDVEIVWTGSGTSDIACNLHSHDGPRRASHETSASLYRFTAYMCYSNGMTNLRADMIVPVPSVSFINSYAQLEDIPEILDRFPMGSNTGYSLPDFVAHSHGFDSGSFDSGDVDSARCEIVATPASYSFMGVHHHSFPAGSTHGANSDSVSPAFRTMLFARVTENVAPISGMYFFAWNLPPLGYDTVSGYSNKFIKAGSDGTTTGGGSGHTHGCSGVTTNSMSSSTCKSGINGNDQYNIMGGFCGAQHTHYTDMYVSSASNSPLYREVFVVQRKIRSGQLGAFARSAESTLCFGFDNLMSGRCNGHGDCSDIDFCTCWDPWFTDLWDQPCVEWRCGGVPHYLTSVVCSGHGTCNPPPTGCTGCTAGYSGDLCENYQCYGEDPGVSACSGKGNCIGPDDCDCPTGYDSQNDCSEWFCGPLSNSNPLVCSNDGVTTSHTCDSPGHCTCDTFYYSSGSTGFEDCDMWSCYGIPYDNLSPKPCTGHGTCSAPNTCDCTGSYSGLFCADYYCWGDPPGSNACSQHGDCTAPNTCVCDTGYSIKEDCSQWECGGVNSGDAGVCSTKGVCDSPDYCICDPGYESTVAFENCATWRCYGVLRDGSSPVPCSGHGMCSAPDVCSCTGGYIGDTCQDYECWGQPPGHTACSQHGVCTAPNTCVCDSGYTTKDDCSDWYCGEILSSDSKVCSSEGTCNSPDYCICNLGYESSLGGFEDCDTWRCSGILKDAKGICSGHGTCTSPNVCSCSGGYSGASCQVYTCFDELPGPFACNGRGTCTGSDNCVCFVGYSGPECGIFQCNGADNTDENVCSGHGTCVDLDFCNCDSVVYSGQDCQIHDCFGISNQLSNSSCSGHGVCVDYNLCQCQGNYSSIDCSTYVCYDIPWYDEGVCTGNGLCLATDQCLCDEGYHNEECQEWQCNGRWNYEDEAVVCSGHGTCTSPNTCTCNPTHSGPDCEFFNCHGFSFNNPNVCHRNGICKDLDQCVCYKSDTYGSNCQEIISGPAVLDTTGTFLILPFILPPNDINNDPFFMADCSGLLDKLHHYGENVKCRFVISFTTTKELNITLGVKHKIRHGYKMYVHPVTKPGEVVVIKVHDEGNKAFISTVTQRWLLGGLFGGGGVLVFVLCVMGCVLCILFQLYKKKRALAKKYQEVDGIDILLEEQKLNAQGIKPMVKIDKSLFEISYDDVQLIRLIGEGGGGASVFLANWKGRNIAFKLFKINASESGNEFETFQKECSLVMSISHPSILKFFGFCLRPPRIGIAMEYCEKGNLASVITIGKVDEKLRISFEEKLRILFEIASALQYLHSRNIIHRDIKPENVLLDSETRSKVMDFGLSKIVKSNMYMTRRVGTSFYMAPECSTGSSYSFKTDVFSYSILAWVLLHEEINPYQGLIQPDGAVVEIQVANDAKLRPKITDPRLKDGTETGTFAWVADIIEKCWQSDPESRYDFTFICNLFEEKSKAGLFSIEPTKKKASAENEAGSDAIQNERVKSMKLEIEDLKKKLDEKETITTPRSPQIMPPSDSEPKKRSVAPPIPSSKKSPGSRIKKTPPPPAIPKKRNPPPAIPKKRKVDPSIPSMGPKSQASGSHQKKKIVM